MLTTKGIAGVGRHTAAATLRRAGRVDTGRRTVSSGVGAYVSRGGEKQAVGGIKTRAICWRTCPCNQHFQHHHNTNAGGVQY